MIDVLAAIDKGGVIVVCILVVLALGTGLAFTKGQHNSIIAIKDQQLADQKAITAKKDEQIAELSATLKTYEQPLVAIGHFFAESMKVREVERG